MQYMCVCKIVHYMPTLFKEKQLCFLLQFIRKNHTKRTPLAPRPTLVTKNKQVLSTMSCKITKNLNEEKEFEKKKKSQMNFISKDQRCQDFTKILQLQMQYPRCKLPSRSNNGIFEIVCVPCMSQTDFFEV